MNTPKLIYVYFLLLLGCTYTSVSDNSKKEVVQLSLKATDLELLASDTCMNEICFDSLTSISQYYNFGQSKLDQISYPVNLCVCFNYIYDSITPTQRVRIEKVPKTYGAVATSIPSHSILQITIVDSNFVFTVGNERHDQHISSDSLSMCIKRLFLNEPDSSRYGEKVVIFEFLNDDVRLIDKYLSQLVIGYVEAQREICRNIFQKDLSTASTQEIQKLKDLRPLRFNMRIKKNRS